LTSSLSILFWFRPRLLQFILSFGKSFLQFRLRDLPRCAPLLELFDCLIVLIDRTFDALPPLLHVIRHIVSFLERIELALDFLVLCNLIRSDPLDAFEI
jgi:hypothetical protein